MSPSDRTADPGEATQSARRASVSSESLRVLLIDDELLVREELGALLEDEGYEVLTGADGEEGLFLFRTARPDMVITDVRMPRRDGLSVAMTIREEDPSVPVTVITGHGTEAMAIQALRAGVTDFVKKPVRLEDLTSALSRMRAARRQVTVRAAELPCTVHLVEHSCTYSLQNDLATIPGFVEVLLKRTGLGMSRSSLLEMALALRELILNAMEHGNLEIGYQEKSRALEQAGLERVVQERAEAPEYRDRRVTVTALRQEGSLTISVSDQGKGFNWRNLPDPTDTEHLLSAHGRGVLLARLSVDDLGFNESGNTVKIVKRW